MTKHSDDHYNQVVLRFVVWVSSLFPEPHQAFPELRHSNVVAADDEENDDNAKPGENEAGGAAEKAILFPAINFHE